MNELNMLSSLDLKDVLNPIGFPEISGPFAPNSSCSVLTSSVAGSVSSAKPIKSFSSNFRLCFY